MPMNAKQWLNTALSPKRMIQGAMIALFSAMHFALCTVVGAAIAAQHEAPNPATEDALYTVLHRLREPLANPLIENFSFDGLIYYVAYGLNSLLWGIGAFVIAYALSAGLRRGWCVLRGHQSTQGGA